MLKDSQGAKNNIDDATTALHQCLKVLHMTNQVYDMIEQKKYFQALKVRLLILLSSNMLYR